LWRQTGKREPRESRPREGGRVHPVCSSSCRVLSTADNKRRGRKYSGIVNAFTASPLLCRGQTGAIRELPRRFSLTEGVLMGGMSPPTGHKEGNRTRWKTYTAGVLREVIFQKLNSSVSCEGLITADCVMKVTL